MLAGGNVRVPREPQLERILVVEDDDVTATVVLAAIANRGVSSDARAHFEGVRVSSLAEARAITACESFAAVVLDLSLPDSTGLDTLHAVLGFAANSAIIVLTALDDSDVALEAVRLGAQDYLFKGCVDESLIVRSLLYSISRHRAEAQLRHAHQMEALGRLAGGVAHDFNNLLTIIIGNAEAVQGSADRVGEVREAIAEIHHAARRAVALTSHLLTLGRRQQFQPRAVDVYETLRGMEHIFRRLVGADVRFALTARGDTHTVRVDPSQLEQLVLNLVLNARDAIGPGGQVTIEVAPLDLRRPDGWQPRLHPGRYLSLTVRDDGSGIAPDVQARMYEPFVTTKPAGKGTGLGLSIVFGIVQQSDGAIRCDSSLGKGTAFTVVFPLLEEASAPAVEEVSAPAERSSGETILLAEDEGAVRALARRILQRAGYRVLEASDGDEALAVFTRERDGIDLVLTDVVMPGLRGPELVRRLDRLRPGLPVLFMSGYADDELTRRGVFPEHVAFLKKPFSHAELLGLVRHHLARRRELPAGA